MNNEKQLKDFLPNNESTFYKEFNIKDDNPKLIEEENIIECIKTVMDPEIPVNIVELGLIYDLNVFGPEDNKKVEIQMTLTAPGCGMGPVIAEEVDRKVNGINGVNNVKVDLVWEPMWNRDMMSEEAKLELGML